MSTAIEIFRVTAFDPAQYETVVRLLGQLSPTLPPLTEIAYRTLLDTEATHLFMLNVGEKPAGMLTVGLYRTPSGVKAWIEDVVVDDASRGHGYGRQLVEYAIAYARHAGADTLALTSNPTRIAANALYRSLGFEPYVTNVYKMKF